MLRKLRKFSRRRCVVDEEGAATVEFVIIFPLFIAIVLSAFEAGWLMTRYMMLDRGVDITVRDLRLGLITNPTHDSIRDSICDSAKILPDCKTTLVVQLVALDLTDTYPKDQPNCYPRNEDTPSPVIAIDPNGGAREEIMFIRVCALVDPIMPGIGLGLLMPKDADTNAHHMVSYSAFMNEPS